MTNEELEKEAEEYTKNLLKKLGIKEDMLLENQPKYLRQESMNFVALDVENVTDAYLASAEPREKRIEELEMTVGTLRNFSNEQATCIEKLEAKIEKMKCDLLELRCDSYDAGMYLRVDELVQKWEIKEK